MAEAAGRPPRVQALMYHDVVGGAAGYDSEPSARGPYDLAWRAFFEHLEQLDELAGAPSVLAEPAEPGAARWCLTFDDGGASALAVGEELARRGWRGYFFVTTGRIGQEGFVTAEAIRSLDAMGHVIGSHSVTHPVRMRSLPRDELLYEWAESVAVLEKLLGKVVRTASVPGGYYAPSVAAAAAEAGIETLFTSLPTRATRTAGACLVVGRYAVRAGTSALTVARAASGDSGPWLRQHAGWTARSAAKRLAGKRYEGLRRALVAGTR